MPTDRELATRVAISGDQAAFTIIVERHQASIRSYLQRLMINDNAGADDLAQETFLAAYQKISTWKNMAKLSTRLHRIAYFKFLDHLRKHKRLHVTPDVALSSEGIHDATDDEILARHLLSLLGESDRAMLTLAYGAGMSHSEIAQVVDRPLGSVKAEIHRAKLKLNQWLEDNDHPIQTQATKQQPSRRERRA